MILRIAVVSLIGTGFGILQSTLLNTVMPMGVSVDIALLILVISAWRYGSLCGEISGFLIGFAFDILSLSPLGFHSFLFTIIGYLYGKLHGTISPDLILLPIAAALSATIIKHGAAAILSLVFGLNGSADAFFTVPLALELGENAVLAPLIFWLWNHIAALFEGRRGGFQ